MVYNNKKIYALWLNFRDNVMMALIVDSHVLVYDDDWCVGELAL